MDRNLRFALLVVVITLLWFLSSLIWPPGAEESVSKVTSHSQRLVGAAIFESQPYSVTVTARGQTLPNRQVSVRAQVSGRIVDLPGKKGDVVELDTTLCRLAVDDREQRVAEAEADVAQAEIDYKGALKLKQGGYQSESAIADAFASLQRAKADLRLRRLNLQYTRITAPFAGIVDERPVEVGDYMNSGDICAVVVELNPLKIRAALSETEVASIQAGSKVQATLVTGESVTGRVSYLSHLANPATRTYQMEMTVPNSAGSGQLLMRAGVAAEVQVQSRSVEAHRVPAALFSLDDQGNLLLKVLDDENRVLSLPVSMIGDDSQGVWVTGLPSKVRLITVGHEYVLAGEQVRVADNEAAGQSETRPSGEQGAKAQP
jgi:multidrug efflux system membrane fusion protein